MFDEQPPVLRCWGEEDRSTQGRRRRAFSRALHARADVVVDLSGLTFADATVMLDVAALARRLRRRNRRVRLRAPQPQVLTLIARVGLHRMPGVDLDPPPAPALA